MIKLPNERDSESNNHKSVSVRELIENKEEPDLRDAPPATG